MGAVCAIFPAVGLPGGLAVGAGAAIGAVTGHMKGGMPDHDLKALGEVLEQGQAGVLVVYATNMASQVAATSRRSTSTSRRRSTPRDPALAGYWAHRRRKVPPPLDPYTVRLLSRQDGRCTRIQPPSWR